MPTTAAATAKATAETTATKFLVLEVPARKFRGRVDALSSHHTLKDVRDRLVDEFGLENLPEGDYVFQFSDECGDAMVSRRQ